MGSEVQDVWVSSWMDGDGEPKKRGQRKQARGTHGSAAGSLVGQDTEVEELKGEKLQKLVALTCFGWTVGTCKREEGKTFKIVARVSINRSRIVGVQHRYFCF